MIVQTLTSSDWRITRIFIEWTFYTFLMIFLWYIFIYFYRLAFIYCIFFIFYYYVYNFFLGDPYHRVNLWVSFVLRTGLVIKSTCYLEIKYCFENRPRNPGNRLFGAKSYINYLKLFGIFSIHLVFTWTSKKCNMLKTLNKANVSTLCKSINFLMQHPYTDAI